MDPAELGRRIGGMFSLFIIPMALGAWVGYKFIKNLIEKKKAKNRNCNKSLIS